MVPIEAFGVLYVPKSVNDAGLLADGYVPLSSLESAEQKQWQDWIDANFAVVLTDQQAAEAGFKQ